ncbi:hypothetical protein ACFWMP_31320 [Paenibacillus sp. NPDC058367]
MELAFQYFFIAGAGVGLGLCLTVLPCWIVAKKISNGGFSLGKKRGKN